jgi:asparagine synthase (glutamine-hydrolysing)
MCGFLGEFCFNNQLTPKKEFAKLLALSKHRGPDNTEFLKEDNFQLGFNRLSILDLTPNGNQPKVSPSGRYALVFNGEIYNYKALQKKYGLPHLKSSSDTAVIAHLLDYLGIEKTIQQLNGMFAIAIIDKQKNTLSLTRDFAGIKPLFYGKSKNGYVFASQFNQIFKHPWHHKKLNLRAEIVKEYFGFGYMQAPNTVFENILQIEPGMLLNISENGESIKEIKRFSDTIKSPTTHVNIAKKYTTLLKNIVKNQLVSDVPIATFLSGGIDSPLITALAKENKSDIEAFTFGIDNPRYDESEKATVYAKHLKVKQNLHQVNEADLVKNIEEHFKYYPEPFGDYSSIPTFAITKEARSEHTVMLSGDGGDELFFGYPRMLDVLNKKDWFSIPFTLRKPLIKLANKFNIINTWAPYYYKTLEEWIIAKQLQIFPDVLEKLVPNTSFSEEMNMLFSTPRKSTKKNILHWLRFNEFYGHMQRVLIKVDRASMGNSLEVRVPFLDKKSIDFAWKNTPLKLDNESQLKSVLKQCLSFYFPKEIIEQKKKGFGVPIEDWLKNQLRTDVEAFVFNKPIYGSEHINVKKLRAYVRDFYVNDTKNGWGVWHIYAWQKWAYTHVVPKN